MNKVIGFFKGIVTEIRTYWDKPKQGEYVPYKEFTNYVVGVSGNNSLGMVLNYLSFGAGCILIGKIYELPLSFFAIIGILGMPLSYVTNAINMLITDNLGNFDKKRMTMLNLTCIPLALVGIALYFVPQEPYEHILPALPQVVATILTSSVFNIYYRIVVLKKLSAKFGKFRPWIIAGALPCIIVFGLIIYLPFNKMMLVEKFWILHLLFSYYAIFMSYTGQVGNISNVISPSSDERAKIMSIGGFVFSLVPSLVQMILPTLVALVGGFESINAYRIVFPPFVLVLTAMTMFLAFGVKERVLVSKTHTAKVSFGDGAKTVMTNKNFLILNFSNLANCLTQGAIALNNILFIYIARNSNLFGLYAGIIGTACIPGLLFAPFLIKKFGKKKLVLLSRAFLILCTFLNYFALSTGSVWLFIVFNYILQIVNMPAGIATSAMNADIWDELQLKSGERLDGMTGIFGLLQTPIMALTSIIMPAIYLTMGFTSDWNIFYVAELRKPIINITIIFSAVAAILGTIPFFFYDLTEEKHKQIIEQLKLRTIEDGGYTDDSLGESAQAESEINHVLVDGNLATAKEAPTDGSIDTSDLPVGETQSEGEMSTTTDVDNISRGEVDEGEIELTTTDIDNISVGETQSEGEIIDSTDDNNSTDKS